MMADRIIAWGFGIFIIVCIPLMFFLAYKDAVWWSKFRVEHHCVLVHHEDGYTYYIPIVGANGTMTMTPVVQPDVNDYQCDNGIIYHR